MDELGSSQRRVGLMGVKPNRQGYAHARGLIESGKSVRDSRDDWSEHRPSTRIENAFIREHGFADFRKWYLGIDDEEDEDIKGRYKGEFNWSSQHLDHGGVWWRVRGSRGRSS